MEYAWSAFYPNEIECHDREHKHAKSLAPKRIFNVMPS